MQRSEECSLDDAINEIAALLAAAYQRRVRIRLVRPTPEALPSTEGLANAGEESVHELTLTGERKESIPQ
jgi:3-methyladenine DNA glycosylase/8-oxoguanine DNA glycosylase